MPPRNYSRHMFTTAVKDADGRLFLTERVPFRFRQLADTHRYVVKENDTLQALASRYYRGLPIPEALWWVIADFQPEPIFDPTVLLLPGQVLYIPSLRTVQEQVFNELRRAEEDG